MAIGVRDSTFSTGAVITDRRDFRGSRVAGAERRPPGRLKKNSAQMQTVSSHKKALAILQPFSGHFPAVAYLWLVMRFDYSRHSSQTDRPQSHRAKAKE